MRGGRILLAMMLLCLAGVALAATYPALTGRIVDQAGIIPAATKASLEPKLAELEQKSGIQLVVATLRSLDGEAIEPYANGLFRSWKLGEAKKNNGVLLLVALNERKVRIEVGYGLEGTLTDALSKLVIANSIAPRFKAGDYGGGIERGVDDIIAILTTDASEWQARPALRQESDAADTWIPLLFFCVVIFIFWMSIRSARRHPGGWSNRGGGGPAVWIPSGGSSWSSGSSSSGWSGGGGFSGGGGSSGGGGASGDW